MRLITEWKTDDPILGELLQRINNLPPYSVERLECEVFLHQLSLRVTWRLMDQVASSNRQREARKKNKGVASQNPK